MFNRLKIFVNKNLKTARQRLVLGWQELQMELTAVRRVLLRLGRLFGHTTRFSFAVLMILLLVVSGLIPLIAFEAHIINVSAVIVYIDPPVITPPGGQYTEPVDITIDDADPDAVYIFYTITPGTDAGLAIDPACGIYPGGLKPLGPITLEDDSVVKAIACDSDSVNAHGSLITTEIYDLSLYGKVEGRKYHDLDQSGTLTNGDTLIQGWHVELIQANTVIDQTITDPNGYYTFNDLNPGDYSVSEELRAGWLPISDNLVDVTLSAGGTVAINFFNFDTGFACVPENISFPTNLGVQAGGGSFANDDVTIASNVDINGDVRSNDEIEQIGGGANRDIYGNATVVNTVDAGVIVHGTTTTGAASAALPNVMINTWKAKAQEGGTINGSFSFPNGTVGLVMGPTEIMGDVTFGGSNSMTVKGPIYIHGNLTIGSNTDIIQDAGFGNQFVTIVVDGTIDISSNITFAGAGTAGTFLLISTHAAVAGDDAAIETNSNNSDLGDVVLYASDGDIHINSNRTLLAAFGTYGTGDDSDDNGAVRLDSNVTVNYRELPTTISCGPRQPYETTSHVLINEFMPNPVGDDQGTTGGDLDGEWVEIFNPTGGAVDLAGYVLYDSVNTHDLVITSSNTNTGGTTIPSGGYLVVYRDGNTTFELNNAGGDTVRLVSGDINSGGVLVDSHTYTRDAPDNKSFARVPDGASNWIDPDATPGGKNLFFFDPILDLFGFAITPYFPAYKPALEIIDPVVELPPPPPVEEPAEGKVLGNTDNLELLIDEDSPKDYVIDEPTDETLLEAEPVTPVEGVEEVAPESTTEDPAPATEVVPPTEETVTPEPIVEPAPEEPTADVVEEPAAPEAPTEPTPPDTQPDSSATLETS